MEAVKEKGRDERIQSGRRLPHLSEATKPTTTLKNQGIRPGHARLHELKVIRTGRSSLVAFLDLPAHLHVA